MCVIVHLVERITVMIQWKCSPLQALPGPPVPFQWVEGSPAAVDRQGPPFSARSRGSRRCRPQDQYLVGKHPYPPLAQTRLMGRSSQ